MQCCNTPQALRCFKGVHVALEEAGQRLLKRFREHEDAASAFTDVFAVDLFRTAGLDGQGLPGFVQQLVWLSRPSTAAGSTSLKSNCPP